MSTVEEACRTKRIDLLKEYQTHCFGDRAFLTAEVKHWREGEGVIRRMPVEEQANYADFVTERMCAEDPAMLAAYLKEMVEDYSQTSAPLKCCPIGNLALAVLTLGERTDMQGDTGIIVGALNQIREAACQAQ